MTLDKKRTYAAAVLYPGALLLVLLVSNITVRNWAMVLLTVGGAVAMGLLVPKRSAHELPHREVTWVMGGMAVLALSLYYMTGLRFGYMRVPTPAMHLWRYILPYGLIIPAAEYTRSVLLQQKNKTVLVLAYVSMVLLDLIVFSQTGVLNGFTQFRSFVSMVLFPALVGNVLYHYLSLKYGMLPNTIYRIVMSIYSYALPILPKLPASLHSFGRLLLPLLILVFVYAVYRKRHFAASKKKSILSSILSVIIVVLMTLTIMLISCQFKYGLLVVGSESMTGTVDKGDAIIYVEYTGQVIRDEEIAVFKSGGTTYIHRVIDIENIDGQTRYYTKGDANEDQDAGFVTNGDIIGVVTHKIKYIGLPTLWVRELFQ